MAAWTGNELMVKLKDANGVLLYTATGTRPSAWTHDKVTSSADAINQYDVSKHDNLVFLSSGDKLMIAGKSAANGGCWGSIGNGYGLAIYPQAPNTFQNLKILVLPYRNQVTDNQKRAFGAQGQSWFPDNEISASLAAGFDAHMTRPSNAELAGRMFDLVGASDDSRASTLAHWQLGRQPAR